MKLMNNQIREILEESGWYPGRKIEIDYMIEDLNKRGYNLPNQLIASLLTEFWNIELEFKTPDGQFSNIKLNIDYGLGVDKKAIKKCELLIQDKIIAVGCVHFYSGLLLVSYSGVFFIADDDAIFEIGRNFFEALETIVYQKETKFIGVW